MEKKIVTKDADFAVYSQIYTSIQTLCILCAAIRQGYCE